MRSLWLMYHDVCAASQAAALGVPRSAAVYHVAPDRFAAHLDAIARSGRQVASVGGVLSGECTRDSIAITFDDGWAGAFRTAVPLLADRGWRATFFVTLNFLGRQGFADPAMLQDAVRAGMEIGVHGVTHRMLSSCTPAEALEEFRVCKERLESLLSRAVVHASLPGGDLSGTTVQSAREAGLESLSTSRPGLNTERSFRYDLRRLAVRESTTPDDMARYCAFDLNPERRRWLLYQLPRRVLGMKRYSRLRRLVMNRTPAGPREMFEP